MLSCAIIITNNSTEGCTIEFQLITKGGKTAALAERMAHFKVPGVSIALMDQGRLEWPLAWGLADSGARTLLTENHMFYACSMAKFITGMTAAALAQAGRVDLDQDVNQLLAGWRLQENDLVAEKQVTLRLLLSHQAGIIDGEDCFLPLEPDWEYPDTLQILEGTTPVNTKPLSIEKEPGSAFAYSDNGYCLAQKVLEDVTGKTLAGLAQECVFAPLGLADSCLDPRLPVEQSRVSSGHQPDGSVTPGRYSVYPFPAAAGLWCTPRDLALVLLELHNALKGRGMVLTRARAEEVVIPHNLPHIGLGNFSEGDGDNRHIYHLGWGKGFQCAFAFWPWLGRGAVIMINSQPGMPQNQSIVGEILRGLVKENSWAKVTDMLV